MTERIFWITGAVWFVGGIGLSKIVEFPVGLWSWPMALWGTLAIFVLILKGAARKERESEERFALRFGMRKNANGEWENDPDRRQPTGEELSRMGPL